MAHAAATMKRNDTALYEALVGRVVEDTPPPSPLPYNVDTSRPSLRTNWTRLVPFPHEQTEMFRNLTSQGFSNLVWSLGKARFHNATAQTALVQRLTEKLLADDPERVIQVRPPPPALVLSGHAASLTPY